MLEILIAAPAGRRVPVKMALKKYTERISIGKRGYQQHWCRADLIGRSLLGKLERPAMSSLDITRYRDTPLNSISHNTNKPVSVRTVRLELAPITQHN